ncbi:MAG TPA: TetR/AcrR family transcriptional regulator C-terminal domain-containing protein [Trebonia sp.]
MTETPEAAPRLSRRERPAKPALTREGIVAAALRIMRDEGLGKVSMRRVAQELDTGHASLYVYVRNTDDLHAQLLDAQLAAVLAGPPAGGTWRMRVKSLLARYLEVVAAHPEIARMAISTRPRGPHYEALLDRILALLAEGGVHGQAAAWSVDLLLLYPTAIAAEHAGGGGGGDQARGAGDDEGLAWLRRIDPAVYPHLAALGPDLLSGTPGERVDWAFDFMLDGAAAAARRTEPPAS